MIINVSIKSKRIIGLAHIQSSVAMLFKDEGVLANHPLSCHSQGVFGRWESERKGKKMKKIKKSEKTLAQQLCIQRKKKKEFELI